MLMLQECNSVHLQNSKSFFQACWAPPSPLAGGSLGWSGTAHRSESQQCASVWPPRAGVFNRPAWRESTCSSVQTGSPARWLHKIVTLPVGLQLLVTSYKMGIRPSVASTKRKWSHSLITDLTWKKNLLAEFVSLTSVMIPQKPAACDVAKGTSARLMATTGDRCSIHPSSIHLKLPVRHEQGEGKQRAKYFSGFS